VPCDSFPAAAAPNDCDGAGLPGAVVVGLKKQSHCRLILFSDDQRTQSPPCSCHEAGRSIAHTHIVLHKCAASDYGLCLGRPC
jgi:hypothetical protein